MIAGREGLSPSYFLSARKALAAFPMLSSTGLVGAMVYYDGAHNDSRMNVAITRTAESKGACVLNHVKVIDLIKVDGKISGAIVRDKFTGDTFNVAARGVINATGPFCDSIRKMDDETVKDIVSPSAGTHLILPGYYRYFLCLL
jgi:glycerol-3-phosphate dehydrogenase